MSETLVQMGPMLLLGGLIAGWSSEAMSRAGGYGLIPDMIIGLVGSLLAGAASWWIAPDFGMTTTLLVGCAGAALCLVAQRGLWRAGPLVPQPPR
jgi:uncharacterized membrane protein YeaQ/YmgE (transglycosylase-associated protein family)